MCSLTFRKNNRTRQIKLKPRIKQNKVETKPKDLKKERITTFTTQHITFI